MSIFRKSRLPVLLLPFLLLACGEAEDTRPGQPVSHRRAAFKEMLKPFEAMGTQLRKDQYKADQFLPLAQQFAQAKERPWSYFAADTLYPPSRAKAAVWSDAAGFESGKRDFLKAGDDLLAAAEARDLAKIKVTYEALHQTCRNCHKTYRD